MNIQQERELVPFQWEDYAEPSDVQEVSFYDWDIEEESTFEPLTLQDLQTEESDHDSLPSLVSASSNGYSTNTTLTSIIMYTIDKEIEDNDGECECPICYEPIHKEQKVKTNCNHIYCDTCMMTYLDHCYVSNKDPCCAMCREVYTLFEVPNPPTCDKLKAKMDEYEADLYEDSIDDESPTGVTLRADQFSYNRTMRGWHFQVPSTTSTSNSVPISFDIESIFDN